MPSDHLEIRFTMFFSIFHSSVYEKRNEQAVILGHFIIAYAVRANTNTRPAVLDLETRWLGSEITFGCTTLLSHDDACLDLLS